MSVDDSVLLVILSDELPLDQHRQLVQQRLIYTHHRGLSVGGESRKRQRVDSLPGRRNPIGRDFGMKVERFGCG